MTPEDREKVLTATARALERSGRNLKFHDIFVVDTVLAALSPAEPVPPTDPECSCSYPNPRWGDVNPSCEVHGRCFESARVEMAEYVRRADRAQDELARETQLRQEAELVARAALSPAEPVQELPVLDPDEQARHEQAMRELAALAFDPNSLDRTEPCPGWWGGHESPAEPKPVEITDEMVERAAEAAWQAWPNGIDDPSWAGLRVAVRAALAAVLSEARTEGGESQ